MYSPPESVFSIKIKSWLLDLKARLFNKIYNEMYNIENCKINMESVMQFSIWKTAVAWVVNHAVIHRFINFCFLSWK